MTNRLCNVCSHVWEPKPFVGDPDHFDDRGRHTDAATAWGDSQEVCPECGSDDTTSMADIMESNQA